jgi:Flp pilus assembly protein TadD
MEYIRGQSLSAYLSDKGLSIDETLRLFQQICAAVNYAHQRGVIHRDLKPGNIRIDANSEPHVLDFGLAKAAGSDLTDGVPVTVTGEFMGTLAYASPEQTKGDPNLIDIRTDVYSLGVILYEMLTGKYPYPVVGQMAAVLRNIAEAEPKKPSTIRRQINDEVETIVLKALAKEKDRRYQSAETLARDVGHYLNGEPIDAKRASTWYVIRKSLRRYRLAVAVATAFVLLLAAGVIVSTTLYYQAKAAGDAEAEHRRIAEGAEREQSRARQEAEAARAAEEEQRKLAEENEQRARDNETLALKRADETAQLAEFQASMLSGIDAEEMGRTILQELREQVRAGLERTRVEDDNGQMRKRTADEINAAVAQFDKAVEPANPTDVAREMMDISVLRPAAESIQEGFADQPLVQAQLLETIATVYMSFGLHDLAEPHLRQVLDTRRRVLRDGHPDVAVSLNNVAFLLQARGDYAGAEPLYREALALYRTLLGDEHADVAIGLNNLATLLYARGDYAGAEPLFREALALRRKLLGSDHPDVALSANNLASLLHDKGEYAAAEPLYREALSLNRKLLGDEHPHVASALNNLSDLLRAKGDYTEAEILCRQALTLARKLLGDEHPDVAQSMNNLAFLLYSKGEYVAAEALYREALALYRKLLGDEHPDVALTLSNLAVLMDAKGDHDGAAALHREVLTRRRKLLGEDHPQVAASLSNLAASLRRSGDYEAAEPLQREALALSRKLLGGEHPEVATTLNNLAVLLHAKGDYVGAEPLYREALTIRQKKLPPASLDTADSRLALGRVLTELGRYPEAESLLIAAEQAYAQSSTASRRSIERALRDLVELYDTWHKAEPGEGHNAKAAKWLAKLEQWQATTQPTTTQPVASRLAPQTKGTP